MLLTPDCILCNYKASLSAIREVTSDDGSVRELITEILQIPAMRGLDWNLTSPELLEMVFTKILAKLKDSDPFQRIKDNQNRKGLELYCIGLLKLCRVR